MAVSTDDVASFYDGTDKFSLAGRIEDLWGANLHYGYWDNDSDEDGPSVEATDRLTDLMISGLNAQPGQRVLDIGCGNGNPTLRLARAGDVHVVGITVSSQQVGLARARTVELGLIDRAEFLLADAMEMPFSGASFDAAWALESMLHMPDRGQVLAETARVLRPGGRLAIADVVERGPVGPEGKEVLDHMRATYKIHSLGTVDEYRELLGANDFGEVEITDITDRVVRTSLVLATVVESKRAEFLAHATEQEIDAFIGYMRRSAATPEIGYLFITATRR
ncbi:SAM-dependent methyltransferase [Nocardia sp. NPDC052566]|uniref:SAM-dependent methyltransferase n=1 Tax=Nocardia sp. NPDC052566 TaxID=3364330 RepID=UPI0037C5F0D1